MGDRPDRGLIPQPRQQTPEHHLKITASLLDGRVGRLVQDPSQILVPLGGATTVVLLGTFIFSGTGSQPRGQFRGRRERTGLLLRDRDAIFGDAFRGQVRDMGIQEVLGTPRSPWQRAYIERVIGSIRRECLDHVIVFDEASLRRILRSYLDYYHRSRTHLSLGKDSPEPRSIQPEHMGRVVALPQVGGLHHRYERRAA